MKFAIFQKILEVMWDMQDDWKKDVSGKELETRKKILNTAVDLVNRYSDTPLDKKRIIANFMKEQQKNSNFPGDGNGSNARENTLLAKKHSGSRGSIGYRLL